MTRLLNNLTIVDKAMNTSKVQVIILIHGPRFAGAMAVLPEAIFSQAQFSKYDWERMSALHRFAAKVSELAKIRAFTRELLHTYSLLQAKGY